MISRRNIRIKVMQLLYALESLGSENAQPAQLEKQLRKQIDQTRTLIAYLLLNIVEIARYAETYARQRASKNIKTEEDLNVNIKIAGNEVMWKIWENAGFRTIVEQDKIALMPDADFIKKAFLQLSESDVYKQYIAEQSRNKKSETEILQYIFTDILLADESFIYQTEELFQNWDDDCEIAEQMILQYLQKPQSLDLRESVSPDKWTFAKNLLVTVLEKENVLMDLIKPKLKNWDPERIAVVDMLLLKMGVSELLFFETIPTKVTINEYIDVAKDYSTKQSGQFVNGILDSIHKDLISQNRINKIDFRKR
ncbi:transcription antitermination factor NusB [Arachidicoccus ginsenosidimutans]|uniref:transcription antitermination factor NusB n=1 Tax=Arachidicoccus sp. BS20 TaxID=1850526 RepID=UPI0007F11F54|nr:transcription antitermination factor NusB [Arachidicoccus sp. BS20]ANI88818.1 transcription antitermination factor NusB [Arachidicoccus sp. BS20]